MKGQLFLLHQKKPLTVLFVCQYKRLTQTSEILDSEGGGGARNGKKCARKGFLPLNYSRKLVQIFV